MGRSSEYADNFSVSQFIVQCLLIGMVFCFWHSPAIQPVKLMVVLFHEMSHGIVALASGGRVLNIAITADEGGWCESDGGVTVLIVSAGYLGSMLTGGLMLYLSRFRASVTGVYILLTLTLTAAIFTVLHDAYSRTFATSLAGSFIVLGFLMPGFLGALFLRLLGTVSCLYSIFDIYWDILANDSPGHAAENDAVAISSITGMAPHAVGFIWLALSVVYFLVVLKIMVTGTPESVPAGKTASVPA